jgi:hypothetical protein
MIKTNVLFDVTDFQASTTAASTMAASVALQAMAEKHRNTKPETVSVIPSGVSLISFDPPFVIDAPENPFTYVGLLCCWLLLVVVGCCFVLPLLLVVVGCCWLLLLHVASCCFMLLHVASCCFMLLHVATATVEVPVLLRLILHLHSTDQNMNRQVHYV